MVRAWSLMEGDLALNLESEESKNLKFRVSIDLCMELAS